MQVQVLRPAVLPWATREPPTVTAKCRAMVQNRVRGPKTEHACRLLDTLGWMDTLTYPAARHSVPAGWLDADGAVTDSEAARRVFVIEEDRRRFMAALNDTVDAMLEQLGRTDARTRAALRAYFLALD